MVENIVNKIIEGLEIVVGWLRLAVKVQEATITGMLSALEALKLGKD